MDCTTTMLQEVVIGRGRVDVDTKLRKCSI